jgi:hypothetical protein
MTEFGREALEAAFVKGAISPRDDDKHDDIGALGNQLRALAQQWRAENGRRRHLNHQLARLEETKRFIDNLWDMEALISTFDPEATTRFSQAVRQAMGFIKYVKNQRRGTDVETILFAKLRNIYVELGGKPSISEDGPLHRFAQQCAALIDADIVLPKAQTLQKALRRWKEEPPVVAG